VKLRYVKKIASLITEDPDIVESINESAYEGLEDADEFEEEELPDGPWFMSISQKNPNLNLDTESLVEVVESKKKAISLTKETVGSQLMPTCQ
jgi:hypothetical protein